MAKHVEKKKSSSTAGKEKGANCQKSDLKVQFAKDGKMHKKDPKKYAQVEKIIRELNKH